MLYDQIVERRLSYERAICILTPVPYQRKVRRYAAYFKGWSQAFGEHESLSSGEHEIDWLFGENKVGFILPPELTRTLHREVLGRQGNSPTLTISEVGVRVGEFHYPLSAATDKRGVDALRQLLKDPHQLHLYLTYHLLYRSGTRIITVSQHQPLPIIYREISAMHIELI
jgi:hypothetical protein